MGKTTTGYHCFSYQQWATDWGYGKDENLGEGDPAIKARDFRHSHVCPRFCEDSFQITQTGLF